MIEPMILLLAVAPVCLICAGFGWWSLYHAREERERARLSHLSSLESRKLAEQYHERGKSMLRQAAESFTQGQEFWATATHTLLDAKRREAKVEAAIEAAKEAGLILDWKEVA